jgi:ArsR family transcriptional regulator, virulence genes transcriptional regulator
MSKVHPSSKLTLIPFDQLEKQTRLLHLISHPLRTRILDFLDIADSPQCVTAIVEASDGAAQPFVSQHLRNLKIGGAVDSERDRNQIFYRIIDPRVQEYLAFLRVSGL